MCLTRRLGLLLMAESAQSASSAYLLYYNIAHHKVGATVPQNNTLLDSFVMILEEAMGKLGQLLMAESAFSGDWKATFFGQMSPQLLRPGPLFFYLTHFLLFLHIWLFFLRYCTSWSYPSSETETVDFIFATKS